MSLRRHALAPPHPCDTAVSHQRGYPPLWIPGLSEEKTDMANAATLLSRLINGWAKPSVPTRVCGRHSRPVLTLAAASDIIEMAQTLPLSVFKIP